MVIGDLTCTRLDPGSEIPKGEDLQYVEVVKTTNRQTGAFKQFAFDASGNPVDADKKLLNLEGRRFAKYGRLHEVLYDTIQSMNDKESLDVLVLPLINFDLTGYEKPTDGAVTEQPQQERERLSKLDNRHLRAPEGIGAKAEQLLPSSLVVAATLTVGQIRGLAKSSDLGSIHLNDASGPNLLDISMSVSRADIVQKNTKLSGKGISVAVWEDGVDKKDNLVIDARYKEDTIPDQHARLTSSIIRNTEPGMPHGFAPGCRLMSANVKNYYCVKWAWLIGCTVISMSFITNGEAKNGTMSTNDIMLDMLATLYPYSFMSRACGNQSGHDGVSPPSAEFVVSKGYNIMSVGSHNDTATGMAPTVLSTFRNPTSSHGDRELPQICANGDKVSSNGIFNWSGTSFAAPAIAGIAALLQESSFTLKSWPEAVRAILMASAERNLAGMDWWSDLSINKQDGWDGSGAVDANAAVAIADHHVESLNAGIPRGWSIANLKTATDIDPITKFATYKYRMRVPTSSPPLPTSIMLFKVVLAWDGKVLASGEDSGVPVPTSTKLAVDLDLSVRDPNGVYQALSYSFGNSFEIIEFWAYFDTDYEIVIRLAWAESCVETTWFSVAWQTRPPDWVVPA